MGGPWLLLVISLVIDVAAVVGDKLECVDFIAAFDVVRNDVPDNAFISFICFRELVLVEDFVLSRFFGIGSGFGG